MSIEVKNITKVFNHFTALKDVSLKVETGELVALLGPSGSGKTTLLRIIAGLETTEQGEILFHGQDAQDKKTKDRNVGFVFQHYALFRHMTVFENIAFGLRVKPRSERPSNEHIKSRVEELLKLVQLDWVGNRFPSQLSGGQRQRIALARALAVEPKVLLLDEPFGSLDAKVRKDLRQWLRRFHDELGITSIFVTHDQEEALEVADKVVVMNEGKIEQIGTSEEVYHHPANAFVLNFLGSVNLFHSRIEDGKVHVGNFVMPVATSGMDSGAAMFYVRPHQFELSKVRTGEHAFPAKVTHINPAGSTVKIDLLSEWGDPVLVEISQEEFRNIQLKRNDNVFVKPKEIRLQSGNKTEFEKIGNLEAGGGI